VWRKKADVADTLIEAILRCEQQIGKGVKVLSTDHGSEYQGALKQFAWQSGIVWQHSAAFVPEQNERAERLKRTLKENGTALLGEFGVSTVMWPKAVQTASYVRHRVPSVGQDKTSAALMFGQMPDVAHYHVLVARVSCVLERQRITSVDQ
jgi:transposase InsO family protein